MRALHRKLLRDLASLRGQVIAVAVVIAAGVMVLVIGVTSLDAVGLSQERFYNTHNFADVFVQLRRAPEHVAERVRAVPGVNQVQTRVRAPIRVRVPDFDDPVRGLLISLPEGRQPTVNRLHLREGRLPEPHAADEVVLSEPFAEAHGLHPGNRIDAIIHGSLETLIVSGIALSPEFIYQLGPGDLIPEYERYAVMWMNRRALARAFDMDGAFNDVALTLQAGVDPQTVIDPIDEILAPYGGIGAHDRDEQRSHFFVTENQNRMQVMATVLPAIFLGVAAFLLNVLTGRIIRTQRQQIAVLKAFGHRNIEIGLHYTLFTGLIVVIGLASGLALGAWLADLLAGVYAEYFRFPEMSFRLQPQVLALAVAVGAGAAMLGAFRAVRSAVMQRPAEAMRPPMPERFSRGRLERSVLGRWLDQPTRIIVRNLARHRLRSLLSIIGIALSGALLLLGSYQFGSVTHMTDIQYRQILKMDLHLLLSDPTPERALAELRQLPGVHYVEGYRSVPVRLINGRRRHTTTIQGMEAAPRLRGLIDANHDPVRLPPQGLSLTNYLADELGVSPGDMLRVEIKEGRRHTVTIELAQVVDEPIGVNAYMDRRALNRLMREGPAINGIWLLRDASREAELIDRLWDMPRVASITQIAKTERTLRDYLDDTMLLFMSILLALAASIAFAVVYNNARIAFAERTLELATLRVLGFTRAEVAWILIGEIALLTLLAIPLGWLFGTAFAIIVNEAMSGEMFRLPLVLEPRIYALSAAGVLAAAALSAALIGPRLRGIDMATAVKGD